MFKISCHTVTDYVYLALAKTETKSVIQWKIRVSETLTSGLIYSHINLRLFDRKIDNT